ncbi:MAG: DUF6089 family protein [Cyclobacteriaceae bacterium]|jgi:hypothetical protein|nr:DUF6089 family protein [Cyclobacteriaceae bacterium]
MRFNLFLALGLSVCLVNVSWAQRSEIGFGLGTFNYTGDLVRTYDFSFSRPAATVFYRSNLSKVVSFRAGMTGGFLGASDRKPIDAFAERRDASFDVFLLEVSTVMEYHFLNWRDEKFLHRFSPYMFGGLALFGISGNEDKPAEYSNVQAAVPLGVGVKYILNPKWYLALEFGLRKTFYDYLDNLSDEDTGVKNYQYANPFDKDNYFFLGITLTRTFYDIPCPSSPY